MSKNNAPLENITRVKLCPACSNCPTIEVHHDTNKVIITDDYGGKVTLTIDEWNEATTKVKLL